VANKLRWPIIGELRADPSRLEPYEVIWGKSHGLTLRYQEDLFTRSPSAFITGEGEQQLRVASRILKQHLNPSTLEELLEAADKLRRLPADYMLAVLRLGLGSPVNFDERFFDRVQDAMKDSVEGVRKAAVWAASYVNWPQYEPLLAQAAHEDTSEEVRDDAVKVLDAYRAMRESDG
jgi:hypothetical protein